MTKGKWKHTQYWTAQHCIGKYKQNCKILLSVYDGQYIIMINMCVCVSVYVCVCVFHTRSLTHLHKVPKPRTGLLTPCRWPNPTHCHHMLLPSMGKQRLPNTVRRLGRWLSGKERAVPRAHVRQQLCETPAPGIPCPHFQAFAFTRTCLHTGAHNLKWILFKISFT